MTAQQLYEQAVRHHQSRRIAEAAALYQKVIELEPKHADAAHMLGIVSHQLGRPQEAVEWIRRAVALQPSKAAYHSNLGNALGAAGQLSEALTSYRIAISIQPDLADAWNNLGNALQETGEAREAVEAHRRALALRPDFTQAWYSLAGAYGRLHEPDASIEAYDKAIQLRPGFEAAEVNRANVLRHVGRLDESIEALRRVVARNPTPVALSNLIYGLYFHPDYDTDQIGRYLARWNELFARSLADQIRPFPNTRETHRRLRVGYVSPDFNGHPAGRFFLPLVAHHDRAGFQIFCYSDSAEEDAITLQIRSNVDVWRETRRLSDQQLAERIREDGVDILVDLTLHLAGNRMLMFARKAAPVQATYLAYPGSSGLAAIDYRISDLHLDPPGLNDAHYSEKTLRLPDCYWCYDPQSPPIEVGELPAKSNGYITFGCLNNFAKVTAPTIRLWGRVLGRVPNSRLILLAPQGSARTRFLDAMQAEGVEAERIEFAGRLPHQQYLELYRRIDISLDTFPCNAHTTAFDSLWMGVPIVSLFGSTSMSRGGLSILSNLQMADWVVDDPERFVEVAVLASSNLERLATLRESLRSRLQASTLMDGRRLAENMEKSYRQMWTAYCTILS